MQTQHLLLLSSIALSSPALAAEVKPTANANGKTGVEVISKAAAAGSTATNDEIDQIRKARKNRVRQIFPPASKRL